MEKYYVTGMTCTACSARVEKAVSKVEGVTSCSVSLLTNMMAVEGNADREAIIRAVENAGYRAMDYAAPRMDTSVGNKENQADALKDTQTPIIKRRLIVSLIFMLILLYFSMGHTMWGWPLPAFFAGNPVAMGLVQLLLSGLIMIINQTFFISGFKSLIHGSPNMDTLVAMGAGASFVYSLYALFAMTNAQIYGGVTAAMPYMHEFYFETAGMILTLITVGKMLEARSKGKTTDALKGLMKLAPEEAVILENGEEKRIPIAKVKKGDIFVVRPGESIPVDGVVVEGHSAINESALTGESIPVDKTQGDFVYSATMNRSGFLRCEAVRVGEDTTLSKIIKLVSDAAATKAPIAKIADKVSGVFVPVVIGIAIVTTLIWLMTGHAFGYALARGIAVLVISCPCALGLATPVAIMVGSGQGAKHGILFKTAISLEETGKIQVVVLDKTGTITLGEPKVTDIIALNGNNEKELLEIACALEQKSEHPLAGAILQKAEQLQIVKKEVADFQALPGNGLTAVLEGQEVSGGNEKFIGTRVSIPGEVKKQAKAIAEAGKTPLFFEKKRELLGVIAVADVMKEDSPQAVRELKQQGIYVVMLTGDNERTAKAIGNQAGVDEVIADVLPEGKEQVIRKLKEKGKVAMVGDGINDAPALTSADIGIAIGAGADVAIDAADVVLMNSRLSDVPAAIRLSRATLKNIHQNLFWAFFYNAIGIPLAAGLFIPIFGLELNPMFGAAAMSLSSFCVVSNALRLNLIHWKGKGQVENKMTKTITIEGMMCAHCEARVKKVLESTEGVVTAQVSHEAGTAVVTLEKEVADSVLKEKVEAQDYKVISVS